MRRKFFEKIACFFFFFLNKIRGGIYFSIMAHFFYLPRIRKENRSSLQRSSVANIHFMREVGDIDYYIGDYKFFIKYLTHENSDIFENFPYDSAYLEICFIFYKDIKELGYDGDIDVNYREMNDYNQKKCS